jgi:hypothetical protein
MGDEAGGGDEAGEGKVGARRPRHPLLGGLVRGADEDRGHVVEGDAVGPREDWGAKGRLYGSGFRLVGRQCGHVGRLGGKASRLASGCKGLARLSDIRRWFCARMIT